MVRPSISPWRALPPIAVLAALISMTVARTGAAPPGPRPAANIPKAHPLLDPATAVAEITKAKWDWARSPLNSITAVSERNVDGKAETWIATPAGVKRVDRAAGMIRHYTEADGLPDRNVVAIHADADGVWCICAGRESKALCQFDRQADAFRVVDSRSAHSGPQVIDGMSHWQFGGFRQQPERPTIAASSRSVAFTFGPVDYAADAVLRLLDKKTQAVTAIPWDPALRSDNDFIAPTALAFQDDDTLWLGSNLGLMRWSMKAQIWRRYLPDRFIDDFAIGKDGGVWTLTHRREPKFGAALMGVPKWTLVRVDTANDNVDEWQPPANDTLPLVEKTVTLTGGDGKTFLFPPRGSAQNLQDDVPVAVTIADDGTVWTSHVSRMKLDGSWYSFNDGHGVTGQHGGFERFDPKAKIWTAFPLRLVGKPDAYTVVAGGSGTNGAIMLTDIPEAAVRPLATRKMPFSLYGGSPSGSNVYWVRQRYPEWLCLEQVSAGLLSYNLWNDRTR